MRPKPQSSPPRIISYPRLTPLMLCFQARLGIPSLTLAPSQELPRVAFCERRQFGMLVVWLFFFKSLVWVQSGSWFRLPMPFHFPIHLTLRGGEASADGLVDEKYNIACLRFSIYRQ